MLLVLYQIVSVRFRSKYLPSFAAIHNG